MSSDMEFWEYCELYYRGDLPEYTRRGQHLYNQLYKVRPDLADKVSLAGVDPFYRDDKILSFLRFLAKHWYGV